MVAKVSRYGLYWAQLDPARASEIAVDQIRTISKSRLTRQLGRIDAAAAQELRQVIALLYASD